MVQRTKMNERNENVYNAPVLAFFGSFLRSKQAMEIAKETYRGQLMFVVDNKDYFKPIALVASHHASENVRLE